MNRDELRSLCETFARRRGFAARVDVVVETTDPVPAIMRSYRHAEISESEKNDLLALVHDPDEEGGWAAEHCCAESACIDDPYADEQGRDDDE